MEIVIAPMLAPSAALSATFNVKNAIAANIYEHAIEIRDDYSYLFDADVAEHRLKRLPERLKDYIEDAFTNGMGDEFASYDTHEHVVENVVNWANAAFNESSANHTERGLMLDIVYAFKQLEGIIDHDFGSAVHDWKKTKRMAKRQIEAGIKPVNIATCTVVHPNQLAFIF